MNEIVAVMAGTDNLQAQHSVFYVGGVKHICLFYSRGQVQN